MKKLSTIFAVLAILLSDVMCAVVAYNYCALEWGGKYGITLGYSLCHWYYYLCRFGNRIQKKVYVDKENANS